jgi:hypothetical protein
MGKGAGDSHAGLFNVVFGKAEATTAPVLLADPTVTRVTLLRYVLPAGGADSVLHFFRGRRPLLVQPAAKFSFRSAQRQQGRPLLVLRPAEERLRNHA